jgi:hypothetical protein
MSTFEERTFISQFDIQPNGCINIRKTTEVLKDGSSISQTYWRCVLTPSEIIDTEILNEPYYANLAQQAWTPEVITAYQESLNNHVDSVVPEPTE